MQIRRLARVFRELHRGTRLGETPPRGKRLEALQRIGQVLVPGYRFAWPYPDWWQNEAFNEFLKETGEWEGFNTQRRWALAQLLRLVSHVPGDTAECGVYRGSSSRLICHANANADPSKHHHLFDSFAGVSEPGTSDGDYWQTHDLSVDQQVAERVLSSYRNKTFYKGWIPERFNEVADRTFSFVHIDVDLFDPTLASLEFFYPRLCQGGILLCDDYHSEFCPGATSACDQFLAKQSEAMLSLPAAGGFFIKGVPTAEELYVADGSEAPVS